MFSFGPTKIAFLSYLTKSMTCWRLIFKQSWLIKWMSVKKGNTWKKADNSQGSISFNTPSYTIIWSSGIQKSSQEVCCRDNVCSTWMFTKMGPKVLWSYIYFGMMRRKIYIRFQINSSLHRKIKYNFNFNKIIS